MDEVRMSLEDLFESPRMLGKATPDEWYWLLKEHGYDVKPLGRGNLDKVPYEEGGGFKVNWNGIGGASIFQYHPEERSRYQGAYYKLGNGPYGKRRFNLDGSIIQEGLMLDE